MARKFLSRLTRRRAPGSVTPSSRCFLPGLDIESAVACPHLHPEGAVPTALNRYLKQT